jgi:hypothetical protein
MFRLCVPAPRSVTSGHAVEIPARRRAKMRRRFGRDYGDRNRRLLAAHHNAGLAPQRLGHVEVVAQPVRGIHHLRLGRAGRRR